MLTAVIAILVLALILWLVFYFVSKFVTGVPLQIVGILFAVLLVAYALKALGLLSMF